MTDNDLVILYEGNIIKVMQLKSILQENIIFVPATEDIWDELNSDSNTQLIINKQDEEKALKLIQPVIASWEDETDQIEAEELKSTTDTPYEPEYIPTPGNDESELSPKVRAVLSEIRLQEKPKSDTIGKSLIFLASLFLFYHLNFISGSTVNIISVIVILLIHELGHLITMKFFGYKDLNMFFIPMFGAAATGNDLNPGEVKKAVVSLMGPLPGIIIGVVASVISIKTGSPVLKEYAVLSLIINGFNLLPIYPLDGGKFFESILFSRNVAFEIIFKIIGIFVLIAMAIQLKIWILLILVYFIIASIITSRVVAKFSAILKSEGYDVTGDARMPRSFIIEMVPRLDKELKNKSINSKKLANYISQVWIKLKIKTPSKHVSIGFTLLYLLIFSFSILSFIYISANQKIDESKFAWEELQSVDGMFTISMPGKAKYKVINTKNNVEVKMYTIDLKTTAFTAGYMELPKDFKKYNSISNALVNSMNGSASTVNGMIIMDHDISLNSAPGKEFIIKFSKNYLYISRIFIYNNKLYIIGITTESQNRDGKFINRYLDSFKLL